MGSSVTHDEAARLLDSAEVFLAADQAAAAIGMLEEALRQGGPLEAPLLVRVWLRLSDGHSMANDHRAAQEAAARATEEAPDDVWRAQGAVRLARAKYYLGDIETAMRLARDGGRALARTNLHSETSLALQWLGNALQESGRVGEAREAFRDALALARLSDDETRTASCLGSLGRLDVQRSAYTAARKQFEECLSLTEQIGHQKDTARTCLNLSVCSFYLGELKRAKEEVRRGLRFYRALGDDRGIALSTVELCRIARRSGEDPSTLLAEAAAFAEVSDYRRARLLVIQERAEMARETGDLATAAEEYERLLQLAGPEAPGGDITYEVRRGLARVRLESGQFSEAENLASMALEDARLAADRRETALCHVILSRVHHQRGSEERAIADAETAIQILEKLEAPYELAEALETVATIVPAEHGHGHSERARPLAQTLDLEMRRRRKIERAKSGFIAIAPTSKDLIRMARRLGSLRIPILLQGETGVGKSLYARFVHESSARSGEHFGVLNCATWTPGGMDSGRVPDPAILWERARGGTLLIRNVNKATPELQRLLVGALEGRGSSDGMPTPQVISTANEELQRLVDQARFLRDLYHRLAGFVLNIPPLRERIEDIEGLAEQFAGRELPEQVVEALRKHTWKGNVRELKNALASAVFLAGDSPIEIGHLPERVTESDAEPATLPEKIAALERQEIREALERTGNNKRVAARVLGVSRKGLIDRLKRLEMWEQYGKP